jgi:phenylpropionate dioxygenase-like ring-hydroxylating dioxygenase large terminal subunit
MNEQVSTYEPVRREDVAFLGTDPVPAAPYHDPAWFELEREAVFKRSWINVGHLCELPENGSFIRRELEVAKASILIVRGKDGEVRAFHNVCTHRGTQLVEEAQGRASKFSCPYHMWTFGEDGKLLSAPDFEQFTVKKEDCALPQVALEVIAGLIFVNLGQPETSLREELGDLATRMEGLPVAQATTFAEYVYEIDANWKLTYDNFQENYHLRFIHPRTGAAAGGKDNPFGYPVHYGFQNEHRTQRIWTNPDPGAPSPVMGSAYKRTGASLMRRGLITPAVGNDYYALFPAFFLFGNPATHFVHNVYPVASNKSRGVIRMYFVGDDHDASERFAREYSMAVARDIHSEDRAVIERGQKGLESGALDVIHLQTNEALIRHLFNAVDGRVRAYKAELEAKGALA